MYILCTIEIYNVIGDTVKQYKSRSRVHNGCHIV